VGLAAAFIAVFVIGYALGRRDRNAQANSLAWAAVLLVSLSTVAAAQDTAAAMADRATFPVELQPHLYYVSTAGALNATERTCQEVALKLIVPSLSRQPVLERRMPVQVGPTLWRLNLAELGWSIANWQKIIADYPYHPTGYKIPLVVQASWFLPTATDASQSDAYYRLLLGARPKNRAEVFKAFGITDESTLQWGLIAGGSPVSKTGNRFVRNLAILRGWCYLTEDVLQLSGKNDPLKSPIGAFPHDGEELLVAAPVIHIGSGTRGTMLNGFLFDGKGQTIDKADTALVEDYTATRGFRHIVAGLSCFSCHQTGPNGPSSNVLREAVESGVDAYAYKYGDAEKIDAFHFTDPTTQLRRDSEDYCSIVRLATGAEPTEAVDAFRSVLDCYDAPVTVERMAAELYIAPEELPLAIGWMNANQIDLGGWIPAAAQNPKHTVPREVFEEYFVTMYAGCESWRASQ
jgi:hypothetical protein